MPGTVLDNEDTAVNKSKVFYLELTFNSQVNKHVLCHVVMSTMEKKRDRRLWRVSDVSSHIIN